jgi:hypothetical protein
MFFALPPALRKRLHSAGIGALSAGLFICEHR